MGALALEFRIRPNTITGLNLGFGLTGVIALVSGQTGLAIFLLFFSQVLDYADGTVARALGSTTAWGRFLDSQFGTFVDVSMWLAISWLLLDNNAHDDNPSRLWVFIAVSVPILGLLRQSLKHQKRDYEHRMLNGIAVGGLKDKEPAPLETQDNDPEELVNQRPSALRKLWRKRTVVSSVWETLAFPVLTVSLIVGAIEIFVAGAFFTGVFNYGIRWLETIRASDKMRSSSL